MVDRVNRVFDEEDIARIANAYHAWSEDGETSDEYSNNLGFCYAAKLEEIHKHDYVLTPGRYVGAETVEDDDEIFMERMARMTEELNMQFKESARLEREIKKSLGSIGFDLNNI